MQNRRLSLLLIGVLLGQAYPAYAQAQRTTDLIQYQQQQTTIGAFDRLEESGQFQVRDIQALRQLGYDPSRSWRAGDPAASALQLGDIANVYPVQNASLGSVLQNERRDPLSTPLESVPLAQQQTLADLLHINPKLANVSVDSIPAVQALINGDIDQGLNRGINIAATHSKEFQQVLKDYPELGDLPIGSILKGDFKGAIAPATSIAFRKLDTVLPDKLKGLPGKSLGILSDLKQKNYAGAAIKGVSLGIALSKNPDLLKAPLGALSGKTPLGAIPGLADAPISKLTGWKGAKALKIPGLDKIPLNAIPFGTLQGILNGDLFGKLDLPLGEAEQVADRPLTGGTKGGKLTPEPCIAGSSKKVKHCAHVELQPTLKTGKTAGKQLISGKGQKVKGGYGILAKINGGWEPTGYQPWGDKAKLKLVLTDVQEVAKGKGSITQSGLVVSAGPGYAKFAMYAQFCVKILFKKTCSSHFIGPIPFLLHPKVSQNGNILIASKSPPSIPSEWRDRIQSYENQYCDSSEPEILPSEKKEKYGFRAINEANPSDLVTIRTESDGYEHKLHREAASAFDKLQKAAAKDGVYLGGASGFRDKALQTQLFNRQVKRQGSEAKAATLSAPPGHSEHFSGYALDIYDQNDPDAYINHGFADTDAYRWLKANGEKYGWVQSYDGNHSEAAVVEPWHWRYQGSETAKQALNLGSGHTEGDGHHHGTKAASSVSAWGNSRDRANLIMTSVLESNGLQNQADVAVSIMNRVTSSRFPNNATAVVFQAKQYEPNFGTSPVNSKAEAIQRLAQRKFGSLRAAQLGYERLERALSTPNVILKAQNHIKGATDFRGLRWNTKYRPGDPYRGGSGSNFFLQESRSNLIASATLKRLGIGSDKFTGISDSLEGGYGCNAIASDGSFTQGDGVSHGSLKHPLPGGVFTSPFGYRIHPVTGAVNSFHKGIDISSGRLNNPVLAADGGRVIYVKSSCVQGDTQCGGRFGNRVEIQHRNGFVTAYNHLQTVYVKEGSLVSQGQKIGGEGSTGISTGVHLDFQVIVNGKAVNPRKYLKF